MSVHQTEGPTDLARQMRVHAAVGPSKVTVDFEPGLLLRVAAAMEAHDWRELSAVAFEAGDVAAKPLLDDLQRRVKVAERRLWVNGLFGLMGWVLAACLAVRV